MYVTRFDNKGHRVEILKVISSAAEESLYTRIAAECKASRVSARQAIEGGFRIYVAEQNQGYWRKDDDAQAQDDIAEKRRSSTQP